jgi:hypothetical protein
MSRAMYTIALPIHGHLYRSLLEFGMSRGFRVLLVEPPRIALGPAARAVLERLAKHEVRNYTSNSWPGTTLLRDTAKVHEYALTAESRDDLLASSKEISAWQAPDLAEDLCLLRPDGSPWLVTIAHEGDCYLEVTTEELKEVLTFVPELKGRILAASDIGSA